MTAPSSPAQRCHPIGEASRAILPESDSVMRKNVDRPEMAQGPQADGRLKRRAEGKHTAVCGHSIHGGSHSVLANTESNIPRDGIGVIDEIPHWAVAPHVK
jgi:hypothetical protein